MSHIIVKFSSDDDGYEVEKDEQVWHLSASEAGGNMSVCTGEFYGYGESGIKFKTKEVKRGGITCEKCLSYVKFFKSIKL